MIARVAGSDCLVQTPCYGIAGDTGESKMNRQVRRALISVSDKTGLVELANELRGLGVDIVSTGGTASALRSAGISTIDVSSVTGFPEMLGGRVKTLHPRIHAGILAVRGDASHMAALEEHRIEGIDLLVVNLYPFEEALSRNESWKEMIENVDVGGPAMIRAAAKNCDSVAVVVDPADYPAIASELRENSGSIGAATRRRLAAKAFSRTAAYDAAIAAWMNAQIGEKLPAYFALGGRLVQNLRYGENPYQSSALYALPGAPRGLTGARQLQGKELSYNNLNDSDAALECLSEFPAGEAAACVIVKHANPCGVGVASSLLEAYQKALRCDPVSAFGGIIALNRRLDRPTAEAIAATFAEVIAVPAIDNDAAAGLAAKKNLRVLLCGLSEPPDSEMLVKMVSGGFLVQDRDVRRVSGADVRTVTKKAPSEQELKDLLFAFRVAKHVKSNAIVFCKNGATVGIGAGQMSRIDAVRIAARKSEDAARVMGSDVPLVRGSVVASDAFFPFADGLLAAVEAGATAVIQPGGSIKDAEIIGAADDAGISMVFTGVRHFRH